MKIMPKKSKKSEKAKKIKKNLKKNQKKIEKIEKSILVYEPGHPWPLVVEYSAGGSRGVALPRPTRKPPRRKQRKQKRKRTL